MSGAQKATICLCERCRERMEETSILLPQHTQPVYGACSGCWRPGMVQEYEVVNRKLKAERDRRVRVRERYQQNRKDTRARYRPRFGEE